MESVFHRHRWHRGARRAIPLSEIDARMIRAVGVIEPLALADLTAPGVMAPQFGLNLSQLASRRSGSQAVMKVTIHVEVI